MFTIDLLKGQGVPIKSSPKNVAFGASAAVVPIIVAIAMFGFYVRNRIFMSVQESAIANQEARIAEMSDAVNVQKSFEEEKSSYSNCLSEVKNCFSRHTQWSPVLVTLVKNMPDSVVLTALDVKQRAVKKKVPKKDDPSKVDMVSVPVRTLQMTVAARPQSKSDKEIRSFSEYLRSSSMLSSRLEDIRVSQGESMLDGRSVVSYQIDCIFKPGL
jgi:Tfp pilus assembly protein PilN